MFVLKKKIDQKPMSLVEVFSIFLGCLIYGGLTYFRPLLSCFTTGGPVRTLFHNIMKI
jgi:hypothetical protein